MRLLSAGIHFRFSHECFHCRERLSGVWPCGAPRHSLRCLRSIVTQSSRLVVEPVNLRFNFNPEQLKRQFRLYLGWKLKQRLNLIKIKLKSDIRHIDWVFFWERENSHLIVSREWESKLAIAGNNQTSCCVCGWGWGCWASRVTNPTCSCGYGWN